MTLGRIHYRDMQFIVCIHGEMETLHFRQMNEKEKYLTGIYDVEIPTLPVILIENVEIRQSHTTTIEVPRPGIVTFLFKSAGYGSVYKDYNGKLEWLANLDELKSNKTLALQPGHYRVVFRSRNSKYTHSTISKTFVVNSAGSSAVEL